MSVSSYINDLQPCFKDKRVKSNILSLCQYIINCKGALKLFSMSSNKQEFDVLKGLLSGGQKNTLDTSTILGCVAKKCLESLGSAYSTR